MTTDLLLVGRRMPTDHIYVTGTRQVLTNVHDLVECVGHHCVIHKPSGHPLVNAPTHWRMETGFVEEDGDGRGEIMERICPHGNFHPDPDDLAYIRRTKGNETADELAEHDCCGCCQ